MRALQPDPAHPGASAPSPPLASERLFRLLGTIDHVSHRIVRGWAWSPDMPRRRLQLDVFHRDVFLGRISTGNFRPDLLRAGFGDGYAGFIFHLPTDVLDAVEAADVSIATAGPQRLLLPAAADAVTGRPDAAALPACHRQVLGPFLAALPDAGAEAIGGKPGRRTRIDALCAATETGISAFAEHIARKYGREELETGHEGAFWQWYIGTYAMEHGALLAPLSRDDISRLAQSRGQLGALAVMLFAAEIIGGNREEAAYRWAIETSHRLNVEDCLVGPQETAELRAIRRDEASAYPLSAFMHAARREIAILASLPIETREERCRLYGLLMVLGLRDPHLLMYMPGRWLRRLLRNRRLFEATQVELFGAGLAIPRDRYAALIAATGFDIATQTFEDRRYAGHRVHGGPMVITAKQPVDVQIFGPLSRRLGLGESVRRIAAALAATPFSVNLVDYDIGDSGRPDQVDRSRFGAPRAARLNILHLNADEIPEALAYLPDVFSQAPLVAIPYWELSRPAGVHRLGLKAVDEVWVTSHFLAGVLADAGRPVHWIGMSCNEEAAPSAAACRSLRARYGLAEPTFVLLTTSDALSWAQRKNPLGVVEAFSAAFPGGEDVALVVKTQNLDGPLTTEQREHWARIRALCDADARITLINESFDAATQRTLLAACDGFVSLHRAEGLGLDAMDALRLGRAVVATAYSGTMDFCTPETTWPVTADVVAVDPRDYCFVEKGHTWAEPRIASACDALRGVVLDRAARERRIAAGLALVAEQATGAALTRQLETRVRTLLKR